MTAAPYNATGGSNGWATPREFLRAALEALGHPADVALDCAATAATSVGREYFGPDHPARDHRDALASDVCWASDGVRYLNPPYSRTCLDCSDAVWKTGKGCGLPKSRWCSTKKHRSRTIAEWMAEAAAEGICRHGGPLIALPPARTDTLWWHRHVMGGASRVLLVRGRLRFLEPDAAGELVQRGTAPMPSAVVEYLPPPANVGRWETAFGWISNRGDEFFAPARSWNPNPITTRSAA